MDTQSIDPVISTFLDELRSSIGPAIREVWLYGSRARGDAQEGSDYDVLVVAEGAVPELRRKVQDAEWACMERHNALVSGIVYTERQWAERKQTPLGWNIQREGKLVKVLGKALGRLFDRRQTADYDVFDRASRDEADQGIADASALISAIDSYIEKELHIYLRD